MQIKSKSLSLDTRVLRDMANTPNPAFKRKKTAKAELCAEEKEILTMRLLHEKAGWTVKQLEDCYGKQTATVQKIINYEVYKHITTEGHTLSEDVMLMSQM